MNQTLLTLFAIICVSGGELLAEDLNCLTDSERAETGLYAQLQQDAYAALDRRAEAYEQLKTPEQIRAYQHKLRTFFVKQLGGFPERTPLNPRTVGIIKADGYHIEKVIFGVGYQY